MITWHPHTKTPAPNECAIICVAIHDDETGQPGPILVPGLYRFDVSIGRWVDEVSGLLLHHTEFQWATEDDILKTLP